MHRVDFEVRDYECDLQGIVNNANYMHYLEHARHVFLKEHDLDFATLIEEGKLLVVTDANLKYRLPLTSGYKFYVLSDLKMPSRARFMFEQKIFIVNNDEGEDLLSLEAETQGACIARDAGKPMAMDFIAEKLKAKQEDN